MPVAEERCLVDPITSALIARLIVESGGCVGHKVEPPGPSIGGQYWHNWTDRRVLGHRITVLINHLSVSLDDGGGLEGLHRPLYDLPSDPISNPHILREHADNTV